MTLHKLWTKMCEKDWRTITKSVFILHSISRDCQADSCRKFSQVRLCVCVYVCGWVVGEGGREWTC